VTAGDRRKSHPNRLLLAVQNRPEGGFLLFTRLNLALLVAVLAGALVPAALARPMVNDPAKPEPSPACSTPTLTGPSQAQVGDAYTVTGCGFAPGSLVPLEVTEAGGCCLALNRVADSSGAFTFTSTAWGAGFYRTRALVRRNASRWRVAAAWSFQAYE
jgi:hypothetical protein